MNINSTSNLSETYIQSLLNNASITAQPGAASGSTAATALAGPPGDNSQLSPLAQVLTSLQQLQQQNPAQYQQVTAQIATNLQAAAATAQSNGNSTQAGQLNQLATDFQTASQTGQLPNIQDLAQAAGGQHHHHHHQSGDNSSAQSNSQSPLAIIENALSSSATSQPEPQ